jgi:hypothetical protein
MIYMSFATYVSLHEKFYGCREKACFVRGANERYLEGFKTQDSGPAINRSYEKCYGTFVPPRT